MKMLSSEVKSLLDKLYNLRGEDSVILSKMNKEREEAIETGERTKNEKTVLLEKIEKLTQEEQTLQEEGEKLTSVLSSINRDEYATVLDRLQIDFDPASISDKLNKMLPTTIDKVVAENEKAKEELENVETEMNNAITKVEELGIRKDEALSNQAKLNEYFELALDGNINITRDAITSLLEKFDFTEDEQREAAKILMFPEDALYEYDASKKSGADKSGKTITEVLAEAKKESTQEAEEVVVPEEPVIEDIFEKAIAENVEDVQDFQEEVKAPEASSDDTALLSEDEETISTTEEVKTPKDELTDLLTELDVDYSGYNDEAIKKILANYDADLIKKNVNALKEYGIDLNILIDNVEIIYDHELASKIEKLLKIGKEARDISLMPTVLVKYDLQGLNNTINVIQISGLDPKKIPLMAY